MFIIIYTLFIIIYKYSRIVSFQFSFIFFKTLYTLEIHLKIEFDLLIFVFLFERLGIP